MNIQKTIGTLLISSGIAITGLALNPMRGKPVETTATEIAGNELKERVAPVSRFSSTAYPIPSDAASKSFSRMPHPPLTGPGSKFTEHISESKFNPTQATWIDDNRVGTPWERAMPQPASAIAVRQLPIANENSTSDPMAATSSLDRQEFSRRESSAVSQDPKNSENILKEHCSTDRSKHVKNRYVGPEGELTLASRVRALELDLAKGNSKVAPSQSGQSLPSVKQASYEAKTSDSDWLVLPHQLNESDEKVMSVLDSATQMDEVPQNMLPSNGVAGLPIHQPILKRLRVNPQVERRAGEHIEYGESLARRNSYLAASEEFTLALLLIAQSHKTRSNPDAYSDRLAQGFTALDEAADFVGHKRDWSQQDLLQQKVFSHKTKLISPDDIGNISRTKALDHYCGFAQSQIEQAIGHTAAGSAALFMLGKIETRSAGKKRRGDWTQQARALVFFRAAMSCNPANAACANELGVLLHDMGRLQVAEQVLKASIASSPTRSAWGNLAAVHDQLAANAQVVEERDRQLHLSRLAAMRAQQAGSNIANGLNASNQWATLSEFHNNAAFPNVTTQPLSQTRQQASNQKKSSAAETLLKKVRGWY